MYNITKNYCITFKFSSLKFENHELQLQIQINNDKKLIKAWFSICLLKIWLKFQYSILSKKLVISF